MDIVRTVILEKVRSTRCILYNCHLITPTEEIYPGWLITSSGKIEEIGEGVKPSPASGDTDSIDVRGNYVTPGVIDTHICGLAGHDFRIGGDAFRIIADELVKHGVTGFLPTIYLTATDRTLQLLAEAEEFCKSNSFGSQILGIHLEGPYLGEKYRGLALAESLSLPSIDRDSRIFRQYPGFVRLVTLAPELPGCLQFISYLKRNGVSVAIGHSEINTTAELENAILAGLTHVTHIFNAMSVRHLKEPGVDAPGLADLACIDDRLSVSLIADGIHVCPELIRLLLKSKPQQKIVLITDSFMGTNMPEGQYTYPDGVEVLVDGGCHRTVKDGVLAGSTLTLNRAIKNMIEFTGDKLIDIIPMGTQNLAKLIGFDHRKGRLAKGMDADIAVFDKNWQALLTMISGRIVYRDLAM